MIGDHKSKCYCLIHVDSKKYIPIKVAVLAAFFYFIGPRPLNLGKLIL